MKISKYIYIIIICLCAAACTQDDDYATFNEGNLTFDFKAKGMSVKEVTTRGADAKDTDESRINSLHIFLFDSNGNYLTYDGEPGYMNVGNNTSPKLAQTSFANATAARTATIYAVANMESWVFADNNSDGKPDAFNNLSDLQNYVYTPKNYTDLLEIPDADNNGIKDMPMVGMKTGQNLTVESGIIEVEMRALMARVDINISIDSKYSDVANDFPQLSLSNVEMVGIPQSVAFTATNDGGTTNVTTTSKALKPENKTIYNHNGSYSFTYYVFENMQQPKAYTYPTGIKDNEKQAHKPLRAQDKATSFKFTGEYTDYNGAKNVATYTLYLGSNHTDNFEVKRNYQYKNNITITGLTKTSLPGQYVGSNGTVNVYGFDARVDVDLSASKFYVSVFRERDIDVHASVVPMDIYTDGSPVTISIENPSTANWVRMEYVSASTMSGNNYKPYTGIRDYFTTNLVTQTLANNHTINNCENKSRVYFYVDENVGINSSTLDPNPAREATIIIKSGDIIKEVILKQPGLRKVVANRTKDGGWFGSDEHYSYTFYIEEYEEYLNHYDPLDPYNNTTQMFEGLPWSTTSSGVEIGGGYATNGDYNAPVYINGALVTTAILNKYGSSDRKYTTKPWTAAEYCNNKNKRNADGTPNLSSGIWYLPGISELESSLTTYYAVFEDFQNYFYWSCAPAKKSAGWFGEEESTTYARATKAIKNADNTFKYAESSSSNGFTDHSGNGGYALRTTSLRIRAAYIPRTSTFFSNTSNLTRKDTKI